VVIDDLQWAETVFVDLVEHVADLSRDAAIFLLCVARNELLEARPGWGGGKLNATSLLLEPLGDEECDVLVERLIGDAELDDATRGRITAASGGNPLYVEEMLAMVREHSGDGEIAVPPTIHALLQARIDSLERDVRVVMERGAVEGEVFHRGAVSVLAPDLVRDEVESHLTTLVRKELIRSTSPTFPDDEGFRFRHLLIRDAAYEALPKATRAELHERFADWLSAHDLVESDEIVGYHLEQAFRYRLELDRDDAALDPLARNASGRLAAAGTGALDRGDFNAGRSLLRRAAELLPEDDEGRFALVPDLCEALWETGDSAAIEDLLRSARGSTDAVVRAKVAILETRPELPVLEGLTADQRIDKRARALAALEAAGHDEGLSMYWWTVGHGTWFACRAAETTAAMERALEHAERAGVKRRAHLAAEWIAMSDLFGPIPVRDAIERVEGLRARFAGSVLTDAHADVALGMLALMQGESERGRPLVRAGVQAFRDAGLVVSAAGMSMGEAWVEFWAGDSDASEEVLRESLRVLDALDERGYRSTVALQLADLLYHQGRYEEAGELCATGRAFTTPDDIANFIYLDLVEGGIAAHRGLVDEGEEHVRHGISLAETTDFYWFRGSSLVRLAEVLALGGRRGEALEAAALGFAHFEAKGDVASGDRAHERLAMVGLEVA
jgi:tetratricopeptide (TPR) repeat protein